MKNEKRHLTGDGVLYAIKTGIEDYYNFNGSPVKNSERIKIINEIIENAIKDRDNWFSCSCSIDKKTGELGSKPESVYESGAMMMSHISAVDIEFESEARKWIVDVFAAKHREEKLEN